MIELTPTQRRALRAAAHHLQAVVSISQQGLTESVLKEIQRSLAAHELIKVKLYGVERDEKATVLTTICEQLDCAPVQQIGNILVLWKENPDKDAPKPPKRNPKPLTKKQAAAAAEKPRRRSPTRAK